MKLKFFLLFVSAVALANPNEFLSQFDLRNVNGKSLVSKVKSQNGGTCWTHGTMAAVEGNLLMTGQWKKNNEEGEPNLAEYHLDWWNGFNQHHNADLANQGAGLEVHQGGDYRVAAAYLSRGEGAVREKDGQSFDNAPDESAASYHYYYARDIEWLTSPDRARSIAKIKRALTESGVVGTALSWSNSFYSENTFYQPNSSNAKPNHAVSIVGWDDTKETDAETPGAWIAKNSWGTGWGDGGFFWISYQDKVSGKHPEMGAVAFKNVEPMKYQHVYYHDYHGWRDTKEDVSEAFNAFKATGAERGREKLKSVSFYTTKEDVEYSIHIYKGFEKGELQEEVSVGDGVIANPGFHTVDLDWPVRLEKGEPFYVLVRLSQGGHAYDKTSEVPVLLGSEGRTTVESTANPGESYFRSGGQWVDLTTVDKTANFCIKALTVVD